MYVHLCRNPTDHLLYEYACHEGNYSLANILTAARYLEGQAERERQ